MLKDNKLLIGKNDKEESILLLSKANRHGLITGASGTGKTVTSKVMAESFSDAGVPVFMADVKGDLSGTAVEGELNDNIKSRIDNLKLDGFDVKKFPVRFWDVYRKNGHPIRFKVSDVGPNILSIMLGLSEAQEGVLNIVFKVAETESLDLDDLTDLKEALNYVGENRADYTIKYGNVTTQSVGVILRSLGVLENQGLDKFFGEPELDINDFIKLDTDGRGFINILDAVELYKNPDLYSAVMLCLLTKLYDTMPEVGDVDIPKVVFFFDEAYFLFREMPSYRLKQIEKIVRLVRSKGIGLYFITHYTTDIPGTILEQLGNRVQHNLRAYTPAEQKIVKAAADSFRTNKEFNTYDTILELGTGEAVVSFQNEKGEPEIAKRVMILPPQSKIGVIESDFRTRIIENSPFAYKYNNDINDESASEIISKQREEAKAKKDEEQRLKEEAKAKKEQEKLDEKARKEKEKAERQKAKEKKNNPVYKFFKWIVDRIKYRLFGKAFNKVWKTIVKK